VDQYFPNSIILGPVQAGPQKDARATAGAGIGLTAIGIRPTPGTEAQHDRPSAYVTPIVDGKPMGMYLLSTWPYVPAGQDVDVNGKKYQIGLRPRREYKPYTLRLLKFSHDLYPGTNIARNFSSLVRLVDPMSGTDRQVKIWMNHPLFYKGETFYQNNFAPDDSGTVLQVVRNPSWSLPYISCVVTGLGLLIHFGMKLFGFLRSRKLQVASSTTAKHRRPGRNYEIQPTRYWTTAAFVVPAMVVVAAAVWLLSLLPAPAQQQYDLAGFGSLPILFEGRVQPMDSVARDALRGMSNYETLKSDDGEKPAIQWLLDLFAKPEKAVHYKVFRVDHPDVQGLLGVDQESAGGPERNSEPWYKQLARSVFGGGSDHRYFSLQDMLDHTEQLADPMKRALELDAHDRDLTQRKLAELDTKIGTYMQLAKMESLYMIPPSSPGEDWQKLGEVAEAAEKSGRADPTVEQLRQIIIAWHKDDPIAFNAAVAAWQSRIQTTLPAIAGHVGFEHFYDRFEPFYRCTILYVCVFLLAICSWLGWREPLWRAALALLLLTFVVHTLGLVARIYISGRPPVTNLPSSAIFIGWAICLFCIALEALDRNGMAIALASAIGFVTLIIAHHLSLDEDNMKVLVAVLDTNIWLATHVVCVTLGYAATFLAGCLGIEYVRMSVFHPSFIGGDDAKALTRKIYGIVCFAMLFSFVGTVLGGIWADQSWGRFWGWDPKENGAVLVVLSNAIFLHARWGGLIRAKGIAFAALFGNIVTSWSWFGTNMLGVGLHSYGFMDSALKWLLAFVISQMVLMIVVLLPWESWRRWRALSAV
jgi:ABC-type transport system involved in cytochrome c biogenesis permease subunit